MLNAIQQCRANIERVRVLSLEQWTTSAVDATDLLRVQFVMVVSLDIYMRLPE